MKMLKFITLALLFSMVLVACGSDENEEKKSEDIEEQGEDVEKAVMDAFEKMAEESEAEESVSCEEYLDKFEKWADKYIEMLKKVKKNPNDATLVMEYAKLAPEMAIWANEWQNHVKCSQDEKYAKRYEEISDRIQKEIDELE